MLNIAEIHSGWVVGQADRLVTTGAKLYKQKGLAMCVFTVVVVISKFKLGS